jgi:Family of unknown function (DUF5995)
VLSEHLLTVLRSLEGAERTSSSHRGAKEILKTLGLKLFAALTGAPCADSWEAMFSRRDQTDIAWIQFALAGMNAHINHDLPLAIVVTCQAGNTVPQHPAS